MNKLLNFGKATERESRKAQGYFDGRFAPRQVPDKKKEESRKLSRSKRINYED